MSPTGGDEGIHPGDPWHPKWTDETEAVPAGDDASSAAPPAEDAAGEPRRRGLFGRRKRPETRSPETEPIDGPEAEEVTDGTAPPPEAASPEAVPEDLGEPEPVEEVAASWWDEPEEAPVVEPLEPGDAGEPAEPEPVEEVAAVWWEEPEEPAVVPEPEPAEEPVEAAAWEEPEEPDEVLSASGETLDEGGGESLEPESVEASEEPPVVLEPEPVEEPVVAAAWEEPEEPDEVLSAFGETLDEDGGESLEPESVEASEEPPVVPEPIVEPPVVAAAWEEPEEQDDGPSLLDEAKDGGPAGGDPAAGEPVGADAEPVEPAAGLGGEVFDFDEERLHESPGAEDGDAGTLGDETLEFDALEATEPVPPPAEEGTPAGGDGPVEAAAGVALGAWWGGDEAGIVTEPEPGEPVPPAPAAGRWWEPAEPVVSDDEDDEEEYDGGGGREGTEDRSPTDGPYGVVPPEEAFDALRDLDSDDGAEEWQAFAEPEDGAPEAAAAAGAAAGAAAAGARWWQLGRRRRERASEDPPADPNGDEEADAAGDAAEAGDAGDAGRLPASWFAGIEGEEPSDGGLPAPPPWSPGEQPAATPEALESDAGITEEPGEETEPVPESAAAAGAEGADGDASEDSGEETGPIRAEPREAAAAAGALAALGAAAGGAEDDLPEEPGGEPEAAAAEDAAGEAGEAPVVEELPMPTDGSSAGPETLPMFGAAAPAAGDAESERVAADEDLAEWWGDEEADETPFEFVEGGDPEAAGAEPPGDEPGTGREAQGTREHRGLAEAMSQADTEETMLQALTAHMPGVETGVVGFEDVEDLSADEAYAAPGRSDLGLRVVTGMVLAVMLVGAVWAGGEALAAFIGLLMTVALVEFYTTLRLRGYRPMALFGYVGAIVTFFLAWFSGPVAISGGMVATTVLVFFVYALTPDRRDALTNGGLTVLGVAWIIGTTAFAFPIIHAPQFRPLVMGIVVGTVAMDVGAYFAGRSFGSRAMAPVLSPNKTLEGLAGGVILTIGACMLFGHLFEPFDLRSGAALGLVVALVAPVGDLVESMVKRSLGVKDMGTILPGHGGILDRVDAFLFVVPAAWALYWALGFLG